MVARLRCVQLVSTYAPALSLRHVREHFVLVSSGLPVPWRYLDWNWCFMNWMFEHSKSFTSQGEWGAFFGAFSKAISVSSLQYEDHAHPLVSLCMLDGSSLCLLGLHHDFHNSPLVVVSPLNRPQSHKQLATSTGCSSFGSGLNTKPWACKIILFPVLFTVVMGKKRVD